LFWLIASGDFSVERSALAQQPTGRVVLPDQGDRLIFCDAPGLSVNIKIDSVSAGAKRLAMGTAEIAARSSNVGVHRDEDELIYFYGGRGSAILGDDTIAVGPGATMYVPQGVRHGFANPGDTPLQFVWVDAPGALAGRFRAAGQLPGADCPRAP
jgi:mannose-6-phosphate isomerase-like protein (cupin superfamily)